MLPLAVILKGMGYKISGSDRSYDQGRTPEKFEWIKAQGIALYPQDGSGITNDIQAVVISKAVEDTIPDIKTAKDKNISILKRADMLIRLFNESKTKIAISGTSGKTTTTGMIGFLLKEAALDPTVMNGGIFRNYIHDNPYSTAFVGKGDLFVTEVDESDGKDIVCAYMPDIAVIHNISLDHQPMDELREMFSGFLAKTKIAVLNADDAGVTEIAKAFKGRVLTYSTKGNKSDLIASQIVPHPDGIEAIVNGVRLRLKLPGRHNVSNALAALAVGQAMGLELSKCAEILSRFEGIRRRMEVVGNKHGITVMDDFAHNPDKLAATMSTLREFPGRLLIFFQPHGYGFLKLVWKELAETFATHLSSEDILYMTEPLYLGGTVDRAIDASMVVQEIVAQGKNSFLVNDRDDAKDKILKISRPGDRIIVMGARDDSLSAFAADILESIA